MHSGRAKGIDAGRELGRRRQRRELQRGGNEKWYCGVVGGGEKRTEATAETHWGSSEKVYFAVVRACVGRGEGRQRHGKDTAEKQQNLVRLWGLEATLGRLQQK